MLESTGLVMARFRVALAAAARRQALESARQEAVVREMSAGGLQDPRSVARLLDAMSVWRDRVRGYFRIVGGDVAGAALFDVESVYTRAVQVAQAHQSGQIRDPRPHWDRIRVVLPVTTALALDAPKLGLAEEDRVGDMAPKVD